MDQISPAARQVMLAFADDEHLMGQQHTEWIGIAPFLEEDLAFASIGQDELGHATMLFELLAGQDDHDIDALAFFRPATEWRSCALTEMRLPEWDDTLVRHWLYDSAEELRWELFAGSSVTQLDQLRERALSEERFHRRHADALLDVLLTVDDARARIMASLDTMLPVALSLFDGVIEEAAAVAEGVISAPLATLLEPWKERVEDRFGPVDWTSAGLPPGHGRTERHQDFAPLLSRMLEVLDLDRAARW